MEKDQYESKYFKRLKFDPKLSESLMGKILRNPRLLILFILAIIYVGINAYTYLPREINPQIEIPVVLITAPYPGANSNEIEEKIIKPIEDKVSELSGIDTLYSTSRQDMGNITILFKSNINTDKALSDTKAKIDSIRLPNEAKIPIAEKLDFDQIPIRDFALYSNSPINELSIQAVKLKTQLENLPFVSSVNIRGNAQEIIRIELSPDKLQNFNLKPSYITQLFDSNNISLPAGIIKVSDIEYQVTLDNEVDTIEELRRFPISLSGETIGLGDIFNIFFFTDEPYTKVEFFDKSGNSKNAIELSVFKPQGIKIKDSDAAITKEVQNFLKDNPNITYSEITNIGKEINKQFDELDSSFISTVGLVFLVILAFLGIRQALVASLSIPLTFLLTLYAMQLAGLTLNFLTVFSLILALGMLVDDAIVIVSAYSMYKASGRFKNPTEVGLAVFKDFKVPIWTTTITAVWAFLPLLMTTGIIGEFIQSIPVVVITALITSTFIAVFINLPVQVLIEYPMPNRVKLFAKIILGLSLLYYFITRLFLSPTFAFLSTEPNLIQTTAFIFKILVHLLVTFVFIQAYRKRGWLNGIFKSNYYALMVKKMASKIWDEGFINLSTIKTKYAKYLSSILFSKRRSLYVIVLTIIFVSFSFSLLAFGIVKTEFFPSKQAEQILINIKGPSGWTTSQISDRLKSIAKEIAPLHEVSDIIGFSGLNQSSNQSYISQTNYGYLSIKMLPDRKVPDPAFAKQIKDNILSKFDLTSDVLIVGGGGPPAGSDIQVNIFGEDLQVLERLSNEFKSIIVANPNSSNVESSTSSSTGQLTVRLDQYELATRGLSAIEVGSWLRTFLSGTDLGTINTEWQTDSTTIRLESPSDLTLDEIQNIILPSYLGNYNLNEIAQIELLPSPSIIQRQNQQRVVRLTAASQDISSTELYSELKSEFEKVRLEPGYSWTVGGENEENQKATTEILTQMGLAFLLVFATMVLELNSFSKGLLALVVIPLAISGVFVNFAIFQIPLSFPSLIGILSLFGIVVYNGILLMEKIQQNHFIGLDYTEGIVDACVSRLGPILFTTLDSIIGLIPITIADPIWRGLGGAVIAGLTVSGVLVLLVLPSAYKLLFDGTLAAYINKQLLK